MNFLPFPKTPHQHKNQEGGGRGNRVLHLAQYYLGAFFAPQKTGLSGGSAAPHGLRPCAAADGHLRWPRPSNPLAQLRCPLSGHGLDPSTLKG
jgi:hypothetical protein